MIKNIRGNIIGSDAAKSAAKSCLFTVSGVQDVRLADGVLHIAYDVPKTNASHLLALVESCGLEFGSNIYQRIGLWIRRYQDAIIEQETNNETGWDSFIREIYVSRYRHQRHGRRDDRAQHWRQYSAQKNSNEIDY
jgi:hypothetical protein